MLKLVFLIIASKLDKAALNIAEKLREKYRFKELNENFYFQSNVQLAYTEVEGIKTSNLPTIDRLEGIVFASKHRSESEEPTLTVHVPGNPLQDTFMGGEPKQLALAWPQRMRNAILKLIEAQSKLTIKYKVSLEATHHGPTNLDVPVWFVEIGSSEKYWNDSEAGLTVAEAIWASITQPPSGKCAVGFGGGHYAPKHTEKVINENFAIGHIFAKYVLDKIDIKMIAQAFSKNKGKCETAIIDWKGMKGEQRRILLEALTKIGINEIIKT